MNKKLNLVLLPTNNKSHILLDKEKLEYISNKQIADTINSSCKGFHLYAISDEKPNISDWYIIELYNVKNESYLVLEQIKTINDVWINNSDVTTTRNIDNCKKIVITTDESIGYTDTRVSPVSNFCSYPTFTNDFINTYITEYNKGNIIEKIEVKYNNDLCNGLVNYSHKDTENQHPDDADEVFHCEKCKTEYRNPGFNYGKQRFCYNRLDILKTNLDNTVDVSLIDNREQNWDTIFELVEAKIANICNLNTSLLKEPELTEIAKSWTTDLLPTKDKLYTKEEVIKLFKRFELDRSKFLPEDASEILPLNNWIKNNL